MKLTRYGVYLLSASEKQCHHHTELSNYLRQIRFVDLSPFRSTSSHNSSARLLWAILVVIVTVIENLYSAVRNAEVLTSLYNQALYKYVNRRYK